MNVIEFLRSLFRQSNRQPRTVSALKAGNSLIRFINDAENMDSDEADLPAADSVVPKQLLENEVRFLRMYAVGNAVTSALGDTPEADAVSTVYQTRLHQIAAQKNMVDSVHSRIMVYEEAMNNYRADGGGEDHVQYIGSAFAALCYGLSGYEGREYDETDPVMQLGVREYDRTLQQISRYVKSLRIHLRN